jgi:hypothetical protein
MFIGICDLAFWEANTGPTQMMCGCDSEANHHEQGGSQKVAIAYFLASAIETTRIAAQICTTYNDAPTLIMRSTLCRRPKGGIQGKDYRHECVTTSWKT